MTEPGGGRARADRRAGDPDARAAAFAAERPRLVGLAYRMLGSLADAEDVVSDAWLRFQRTEDVERPPAWLTTVTTRLAIDRLRGQQRRREEYVGPWLPEPVPTDPAALAAAAAADPARSVALAESLTLGFLVVLDRLTPVERAVFLLADVFGTPFADIAGATGRSPEACRQLASRARRKVRDAQPPASGADDALLADLVAAMAEGDADRVVSLLAPDVVLVSDGGPARRAARRPVVGPDRVARLLVNLAGRTPADASMAPATLNGGPALVVHGSGLDLALSVEPDREGRVRRLHLVLNPDKLAALDRPPPLV